MAADTMFAETSLVPLGKESGKIGNTVMQEFWLIQNHVEKKEQHSAVACFSLAEMNRSQGVRQRKLKAS